MELAVWNAVAAVLLAWGALELRGVRRELGRRGRGTENRETERAEPGDGERGPLALEEAEGRADPAMLEGFDNLMRYTERTAREKDTGTEI